ncbi:MAG: hypothetical protein AUJ85_05395 [Elusimicrobia bacterium CG1_02_37_114]|nr:MAG: hypothetical protein AUJ85_05395 [Elusimicrobia bacterium CG1_02_37_114]
MGNSEVNRDSKKYEIHLVSHTHWDREWYGTFQEFRIRLVQLIDKLLSIFETIPDYKYFVLDGQTVVLEDYLEIRPEKRNELEKYVREGRLFVGPWYILPDEFLVSGESTIRNLLIGHKIAEKFGHVMKAGYIPDPFGHISQLPQILSGFGIDSVIFSRGLGDEGEKLGQEFMWESPDGSKILALHQIIGAYGNAAGLGYTDWDATGNTQKPLDLENALERANSNIKKMLKYSHTKYLLFNNGVDHLEPQPEIPQVINYLNEKLSDAYVIHSHYENLIEKIKSANPELQKYNGELRGARFAPLLPGVLSARMYLKQANERAQTVIEKFAEPLSTFAFLEGNKYPDVFLEQAWKYLIQCHPHDSICGCSIDEVHQDVMRRLSWSQEISNVLINQSIEYLIQRINTESSNKKAIPLIVFNTLGWSRSEVVDIDLVSKPQQAEKHAPKYVLKDENGRSYEIQYKRGGERVSVMAKDIPPCGYKVFHLVAATATATAKSKTVATGNIKTGKNYIENRYLRLEVNSKGSLTIMDKINNAVYKNFLLFEDTEDAGDEYNYSPIKKSLTILSLSGKFSARTSIVEKGPIYAVLKVYMKLKLPEGLTESRKSRSRKLVECPVETDIKVYADSPRIDIETTVENNARDHRLRVLFPTDIVTDCSHAEGQFDVVKRLIDLPEGKNWSEQPCPTNPQQSFVSISDGGRGITIINQGLPEYEVIKEKNGSTIALTLLRCVGWLSRDDFMTRKGNAGPSLPTQEAQCIGLNRFNYSIVLHSGSWEDAKVWKHSYNFNTHLIGITSDQHKGTLPLALPEMSFVNVEPDNLLISAVKKAERTDDLIIRLWNISSFETTGKVKLYKNIKQAKSVNLNEEEISEKLKLVSSDTIELKFKPFQIRTLKITLE